MQKLHTTPSTSARSPSRRHLRSSSPRRCSGSCSSSASSPSRRRSTPAFRRACRRAPPSPCRLPAAAPPSRASLRRRSRSRRPPRRSRRLRRSRTRRPWRTARLLPLRRCAPPRRAQARRAPPHRPHRLTSRAATPRAGAGRGREQAAADHRHRRRRHAALDGLLRREPQAPRHEGRERRQGRRLHEVVEPAPPVSGRRRLNHTPPRSR